MSLLKDVSSLNPSPAISAPRSLAASTTSSKASLHSSITSAGHSLLWHTGSSRGSTSSLAEIALSDQPLTSSTSLMNLLAPDVQHYILHQGASLRVAKVGSSPATIPESPSSSKGEPAAAKFGRRKKTASGSPPRPPPHYSPRRPKPDPCVSPVAAIADDYLSQEKNIDFKDVAAVKTSSPPNETETFLTATPLLTTSKSHTSSMVALKNAPATGPTTSRTMKAIAREQSAVALLHRKSHSVDSSSQLNPATTAASASPPSHSTSSTLVTPSPLVPHHDPNHPVQHPTASDVVKRVPHGSEATLAQISAALQQHSSTNTSSRSSLLYDSGHSSSMKDLGVESGTNPQQRRQTYQGLNGLSFSLSQASLGSGLSGGTDHTVSRFRLPDAEVLDQKDGYTAQPAMDRWHDNRKQRLFDDAMLSKPKLLVELEKYLNEELKLVGYTGGNTNNSPMINGRSIVNNSIKSPNQEGSTITMEQLQIFHSVFLRFMDEFPSYKPILSRVLKAYEDCVQSQRNKLELIPQYQRKLGTMQEATKRQLEEMEEEYMELQRGFEHTIEKLEAEVAQLKEEAEAAKVQYDTTEADLSNLKLAYEALQTSNSTLKNALTRFGSEKTMAWEEKSNEADLNKKLKAQLGEMQKHQQALMQEMGLLRTHATAVQAMNPTEYARLQVENGDLQAQVDEMTEKYQSRSAEYFALLNAYDIANNERRELQQTQAQFERMKNNSTPRPEWRRLVEKHYLPDSVNLDLQSSESLLDELCGEIDRLRNCVRDWEQKYPSEDEVAQLESQLKDEGVKREASKYLKVRGSGPDVPIYLRWGKAGAKIRNKNINKRATEIFIKEVWQAKHHTPEAEGGEEYKRMSLEDFLYVHLKKAFGFQEAIAHYAYSILDSLDRFRFDGDCDLFLQILNKKVSEAVYVDQFNMMDELKEGMEKADAEYHKGRVKGRLPRRVLIDVLTKVFSNKGEGNLRKVNRALFVNDKNEMINYRALFEEDREGNQGPFVECIRDQHLAEIFEFMEEIKNKITEKAARYDGKLKLAQVREIILVLDPLKSTKDIDTYLREGLDINRPIAPSKNLPDIPGDDELIDPEVFLPNLFRRLIKRTGPPPMDKLEHTRRSSLAFSTPQGLNLKAELTGSGSQSLLSPTGSDGGDMLMMMRSDSPSSEEKTQMLVLNAASGVASGQPVEGPFSTPHSQSRKQLFSNVARRISMPIRQPSLLNVVLAAKEAGVAAITAAANNGNNNNAAGLNVATGEQDQPVNVGSPTQSPLSPYVMQRQNSLILDPNAELSLNAAPSLLSTRRNRGGGSMNGLNGSSIGGVTPTPHGGGDGQFSSPAAASHDGAEAPPPTQVLTLHREMDPPEWEHENVLLPPRFARIESIRSEASNSSNRTSPRLHPSAEQLHQHHQQLHLGPSLNLDLAAGPRATPYTHTPPRTTPHSSVFTPITTALVATRKMMRQSLRHSGGLVTLLKHMAAEEGEGD